MNQQFKVGQTFFPNRPAPVKTPVQSQPKTSFENVLQDKIRTQTLEFSQHAQKRLQSRGIELTGRDLQRLEEAVQKAADKGARESLVWMDRVAYVVSVKNHTVITAVDEGNMKDHVFTQIDSAIFV